MWWRHRHEVDQHDLQGNILCGYGNDFGYARYLFVTVGDERAGRAWLGKLADEVTDAFPWGDGYKPLSTLNVALTCRGLHSIGVPQGILDTFPKEFRQGMGTEERARFLGDTGESEPAGWEQGLKPEDPLDILVTLTARDPQVLARRAEALRVDMENTSAKLQVLLEQEAALLDHDHVDVAHQREHFGFADGFSQPAIRGNAGPQTRNGMGTPLRFGGWSEVAPGEFVLGYRGEDGLPPAAPVEPLGRSGSFMVVRKLEQHVERFNDYVREQADKQHVEETAKLKIGGKANNGDVHEWLAGQIVGRWKDGRSLVLSREPATVGAQADKNYSERINHFRYKPDGDGYGCPLGAHVRRANPRDGFGWQGRLTKRHRIIRRSMPYGRRDEVDRGLMFICFQASIARQFEIIQGRWLNDGDAFWLGADTDFLTTAPAPRMTVQIEGGPPLLLDAPREPFVTTRGGGYFFAPGLAALRALASAYWR
jgi:Dyp-type peroxidase family